MSSIVWAFEAVAFSENGFMVALSLFYVNITRVSQIAPTRALTARIIKLYTEKNVVPTG